MRRVEHWQAQSVLNKGVRGTRYGFSWSLNPYRGCAHACRYCYARDTHRYLDLSIGTEFETVLFVKDNLRSRLERELRKVPLDDVIAIGTATDPYQPLEGQHRMTRSAIEVLAETGHPFTITTKSPLILRDLDLLVPLAKRGQFQAHVSLTSLDGRLIRALEPGTSSPSRRLAVMARLTGAGIPVALFASPIIPGLTDSRASLDSLFEQAKLTHVSWVMTSTTRLSPTLLPYFLEFADSIDPTLRQRLEHLYQGGAQHPFPSYQRKLEQWLESLYEKHGLQRGYPRPRAHRSHEQLSFMF